MIKEVGYCAGIENYSRYLSGRAPGEPTAVPVRLPAAAMRCLFVDESIRPSRKLGAMYRGIAHARRCWSSTASAAFGARQPAAEVRGGEQLAPQMISSPRPPGATRQALLAVVEQLVRPRSRRSTGRSAARRHAAWRRAVGNQALRCARERVLITTLTKRMAEDLNPIT